MRKNKRIIVVALTIMLTVSVGYALFSQTINITGSATAQGSFQITTTCNVGFPNTGDNTKNAALQTIFNSVWDAGEAPVDKPSSVNSSSCTVNGNNVTMTADLKYPGATRLFTIKMTNTGTVDALILIPHGSEMTLNEVCFDNDGDDVINTSNECLQPNATPDNDTQASHALADAINDGVRRMQPVRMHDLFENDQYGRDDLIILEKANGTFADATVEADVVEFVHMNGDTPDGIILKPNTSMYAVGEISFNDTMQSVMETTIRNNGHYRFSTTATYEFHFNQLSN